MMEHAVHISNSESADQTQLLPNVPRTVHGTLFVLGSVGSGLLAAWAGYTVGTKYAQAGPNGRQQYPAGADVDAESGVLIALCILVAGCLGRALLSSTELEMFPGGFASPKDTTTTSPYRDLHELLVGLTFATAAIALGDHVGGFPDYATHGMNMCEG